MNILRKREYWVDFLKGVMIIFVVIGHCGINSKIMGLIYLFHMPIFFVISGYLYDGNYPLKEFIKKKFYSLIYPYCVFGVLIILWNTVIATFQGRNSLMTVGKRIEAFLYGNCIWENNYQYIGVLWFLLALFTSEMFFYFLHKIGSRMLRTLTTCIIIAIGAIFSVVNVYQKIRLPWCIDIACISFVFLFAGKLIKRIIAEKQFKIVCVGGYHSSWVLFRGFEFVFYKST